MHNIEIDIEIKVMLVILQHTPCSSASNENLFSIQNM